MCRRSRGWTMLLALALVLAAGCSRSPEAQKAHYLERGDKYAAKEQYREAVLEYRNVLRLDPANPRAMRQLGIAHYQLGEPGQAIRYLLKAQELTPDDIQVRVKLGGLYLLAGKRNEAREEVAFVLGKEPTNLDGLALLADLSTSPEEIDATLRRLEEARSRLEGRAKFHLALASLYLRKQEVPRAERALQEAVAREPKSVEAHSFLASFYLARRDVAQAEREFKIAAELAPAGSPARLRVAEFYLSARQPEEARRILLDATQKAPDFLPAWRRLALLELEQRNYDASLKALQGLLKKSPSDLEGQFLLGRVRLAKGEPAEAIKEFQKVLKLEPQHAPAHFQLALAQLQSGNVQQAKTELKEATSLAPNFTEAVILLAQLNIQSGAVQPAIDDLEAFLARRSGSGFEANFLLGSAYLAKKDPVKATAIFRRLAEQTPKDPRGPYLVGVGLRAQGKAAEAKREFEGALAMAPGYLEPMTQLVSMAFAERQPDAAIDRLKKQIALAPRSGGLQWLLGTAYMDRRDPAAAETALLKAIELDPTLVDAYVRLAQIYMAAQRSDQALAKLNEALKVSPQSIPAQMQLGLLYEATGDTKKAQQAYEKVLALNPRFAPAANNLAALYSEHGGDKEKALELAQRAKEIAPDDPHVSDTLGWILYKRGVYQRAADLLRESAAKLPNSPAVQYHLGLASLKVGDTSGARKALTVAVNSPGHFPGKDEARKTLAEIQ